MAGPHRSHILVHRCDSDVPQTPGLFAAQQVIDFSPHGFPQVLQVGAAFLASRRREVTAAGGGAQLRPLLQLLTCARVLKHALVNCGEKAENMYPVMLVKNL